MAVTLHFNAEQKASREAAQRGIAGLSPLWCTSWEPDYKSAETVAAMVKRVRAEGSAMFTADIEKDMYLKGPPETWEQQRPAIEANIDRHLQIGQWIRKADPTLTLGFFDIPVGHYPDSPVPRWAEVVAASDVLFPYCYREPKPNQQWLVFTLDAIARGKAAGKPVYPYYSPFWVTPELKPDPLPLDLIRDDLDTMAVAGATGIVFWWPWRKGDFERRWVSCVQEWLRHHKAICHAKHIKHTRRDR